MMVMAWEERAKVGEGLWGRRQRQVNVMVCVFVAVCVCVCVEVQEVRGGVGWGEGAH
jgi:hypothetical protein